MWESRRPPSFRKSEIPEDNVILGDFCFSWHLGQVAIIVQWTDRIRQVKIVLVVAAVIIEHFSVFHSLLLE